MVSSSPSFLHLKAVDGLRAITHLSLIALHTTMILSGHLPSEGSLWRAVSGHWIFTFFQFGAVQVDIMFMLSSFLLVYQLIERSAAAPSASSGSILSFAVRRALRMLPSIVLVLCIGLLLGDCFDESRNLDVPPTPEWPARFAVILGFVNNYFSQGRVGSFTTSLMWSCSVDLHVSVIIFVLGKIFRPRPPSIKLDGEDEDVKQEDKEEENEGTSNNNNNNEKNCNSKSSGTEERGLMHGIVYARRMSVVFMILVGVALYIRYSIFDPEVRNIVKLGQYSHFGLLMTNSSYGWMQTHYGHQWHTTNSAQHIGQAYLNALYFPTHARFGPFAVGGLLACMLYKAVAQQRLSWLKKSNTSNSNSGAVYILQRMLSFALCVVCFGALASSCVPPPPINEIPAEAQLIATVALRIVGAAAAAYLLYGCLVPSSSPHHNPLLATVLGWSLWKPIAEVSFCSYLLHFRLLMEMVFNPAVVQVLGTEPPPLSLSSSSSSSEDQGMGEKEVGALVTNMWVLYIVRTYVLCVVLSLLLGAVMHYGFERTATDLVRRCFPFPVRVTKAAAEESKRKLLMKSKAE